MVYNIAQYKGVLKLNFIYQVGQQTSEVDMRKLQEKFSCQIRKIHEPFGDVLIFVECWIRGVCEVLDNCESHLIQGHILAHI